MPITTSINYCLKRGYYVTAGASPTLMNNVFVNVQTPIVDEETRVTNPNNPFANRNPAPFGSNNTDVHPKTNQVIVGGSVYQFVRACCGSQSTGYRNRKWSSEPAKYRFGFQSYFAEHPQDFCGCASQSVLACQRLNH